MNDAQKFRAEALQFNTLRTLSERLRQAGKGALAVHATERAKRLSLQAPHIYCDFTRQRLDGEAIDALMGLASALMRFRDAVAAGEAVNNTEMRSALHQALRAPQSRDWSALGRPMSATIIEERNRARTFAEGVRSGRIKAADGRPFKNLVHLGVGGSDLGPRMIYDALKPVGDPQIALRFASNIDPEDLAQALHGLDPRETLLLAVSKTFTTQETMANFAAARAWLESGVAKDASLQHLIAATAKPDLAMKAGIAKEHIFAFWDWVGGRFSVWSNGSLSVEIALGADVFDGFLQGAADMDAHVMSAPAETNAGVIAALVDFWNASVLDYPARAVTPYATRLRLLPSYLQQLVMESDGKSVQADGAPAFCPTAPVIFGGEGATTQHSFFQWLHQGTTICPVDFIVAAQDRLNEAEAQKALNANALAQAEALWNGRSTAEAEAITAKATDAETAARLAPHKTFQGGRPSSMFILDRLEPQSLGALIALYEYRTAFAGVLAGINPFDQWGVELGKELAQSILKTWDEAAADPVTDRLLRRLKG
ncbi:MAG: glucose-6-phosphate isomerase [Caulobacterales bacterium]